MIRRDTVDVRSLILDVCFFSSRRRHTRYWRDWSSDVCSSDLPPKGLPRPPLDLAGIGGRRERRHLRAVPAPKENAIEVKIGRASCRGRGEISGVGGSLKKKKTSTSVR